MLLAYNTNGFAHHDPAEAIAVLAEIGYRGVGLTIDHGLLDPRASASARKRSLRAMRRLLAKHKMRSVVETGARFLMDPSRKHEPTLMSAQPIGRKLRLAFLQHAIDVAAELQSDCVSLWSGALREPLDDDAAFARLAAGLAEVCDYAEARGVLLGFEPEPGMFIATLGRYSELLDRFDHPALKLTIDVGHLHCQRETPIAARLRHWAGRLVNVHLEDMRAGVHEHLMFGEGEMDFPPILAALAEIQYAGLVQVELSRHSHQAPEAARRAWDYLSPMMPAQDSGGG